VNPRPGVFVSVDGPGGVGKSTIVALVAEHLAAHGMAVHATTEPSRTPLGNLIRAGTDTYHGRALAHLVAGDRHHHLVTDIRPRRQAGAVVLCDRYIPSSLVLQRIDGLSWEEIWQINAHLERPDLTVILNADPAVIAARLTGRGGTHSRFERQPGSSQTESDLYRDTAARLTAAGWPVFTLECTAVPAAGLGTILTDRILALLMTRSVDEPSRRPVATDVQHR
jgi:dTMP kinase